MKNNYYIIFDTNITWGNPLPKDFYELKAYIDSTGLNIALCLPETVKEELKKKIIFDLREARDKYQSSIKELDKFGYLGLQSIKNIEIDEEIIKAKLDQLLKENGLEILDIPYTKINWRKIHEKAVYYLPPFEAKEKEKGFKDSVIAETIFAALESFERNATKIFVCKDGALKKYVASKTKNLLIYESIKDLESHLKADIQKIGNIDEFIKQADEIFYVQIHDIEFFGKRIDFKSFLYEKFADILNGYNISYSTTGSLSEVEKYLNKLTILPGDIIKLTERPFFVKKEKNIFYWESRVALSRLFAIPEFVHETIAYDFNFLVTWKTVLKDSKLEKPELINVEFIDCTTSPDIRSIFPGISDFHIYPASIDENKLTLNRKER